MPHSVTTAVNPLLTTLTICGLYFRRQPDVRTGIQPCRGPPGVPSPGVLETGNTRRKWIKRKSGVWSAFWPLCVLVIAWTNLFRMLPSLRGISTFDEKLFLKTVCLVWYLQCCLGAVVCFRASLNPDLFPTFLKLLQQRENRTASAVSNNNGSNTDSRIQSYCNDLMVYGRKSVKYIHTMVITTIALTAIFVACNIGLISYILFSPDSNMDVFRDLLYFPIGECHVTAALLILLQCLFGALWLLPLLTFVVFCHVMIEQFQAVELEVKDWVARKQLGQVQLGHEISIEGIRQDHLYLIEMVDSLDHIYNFFTAVSFLTNVPIFCLTLYMMIWPTTASTYLYIFNAFILGMDGFHLYVVSRTASVLNTKAHVHLGYLYRMDATRLAENIRFQVLLFISRLEGSDIGITAWELFTVTKPSLLTMGSVLITYFFILVQFKMSVHDVQSAANASSSVLNATGQ